EPSDTKRVVATTATKTTADGRTASGTSQSIAPSPVATPLPPRKPRKTDQQLPTTAATTGPPAATTPPTITASTPFTTSPTRVRIAGALPAVRRTFVAPIVPLP